MIREFLQQRGLIPGSGGIHGKLLRIVLTNSLLALFLMGAVSFYGMYDAAETAREIGWELAEDTFQDSSELLVRQRQQELIRVAEHNAEAIRHHMEDLVRDVEGLAREMEEIERNPGRFLPQAVAEPSPDNYGELSFYLQYGQDFSLKEHQGEIALAANARDLLMRTAERDEVVGCAFVASHLNFSLSVDNNLDKSLKKVTIPPVIFNALAEDWYQAAIEKNGPVFTKVRPYVSDGQLGLFCAAPYKNAAGETAGVAGVQASLEELSHLLNEVDLYSSGFCFVMDDRGYVILSSLAGVDGEEQGGELAVGLKQDLRESGNEGLASMAREMTGGSSGVAEATVNGEKYYFGYAPVEGMGWSFAAAISAAEVIAPVLENDEDIKTITREKGNALKGRMLGTMLLLAVFVLVLLAFVSYRGKRLSAEFAKPIRELSDGVKEIAGGNLSRKLQLRTGDEIEHLAENFNAMTEELQAYIGNLTRVTAEKEHIATELSVAKRIQSSMLPNIFPPFPERKEFDIYATMEPAKEVGGDFYDFYLLDENHVIITIADVSGKGVPAALFMVIAKTILKNFAQTMVGEDDLAPLVACANEQLCQNNDAMMFVTAFVGMLEVSTGRFTYVNAGHNPSLVYRAKENSFSYLPVQRNFVLGGTEGMCYKGQKLTLEPGDRLFLYTDGVTEALNEKEELYGEQRLLAALNQAGGESVRQLVSGVRKSLGSYVGEAEQSDDITMLVLAYYGKEPQTVTE